MLFYRSCRVLFRIFFSILGRWQVIGKENLPKTGPVILVANHKSNWDPVIAAAAVDRFVSYMAKAELFSNPVLKKIMDWLSVFPIKRGKSDIGALRTALDILAQGRVLGMFPEGTRSTGDSMLPFKAGIAMLAYKSGCPIVPVALINSGNALKGWVSPVKVVIGRPFIPDYPEGKLTTEDLEKIAQTIQDRVRLLLAA